MYKIRGADQIEYGPVSQEVLREWISERRVTPQTLLQRGGENEWRTATQYPEFQLAFAAVKASPVSTTAAAGRATTATTPAKTSSGLAISSLVLGVVGLLPPLGMLTAVPAIITGHIARRRVRRAPSEFGGRGMSLAGLITGYLGLVLSLVLLAAAWMLPVIAQRQSFQRAFYESCRGNLRQLWMASQIYAHGHGAELPSDFESMRGDLTSAKVLVCPDDKSKVAITNWSEVGPQNITYEFPAANAKLDQTLSNVVIFRCPFHDYAIYGNGRFSSRRRTKSPPALLTNSAPSR